MTDLEAIELRKSRRSYTDTPISPDKVKALKQLAEDYNKLGNLSIQYIEDGRAAFQGFTSSYGMFKGVRSYFALVGKASDPNLKEKSGYYGELLVLGATRLKLGTCWVGGTFSRKKCPCSISPEETLISLITVGNVAEKKTFKENLIYKATHRHSKSLEELYQADTETVPDWLPAGIKAVQKAPSANNQQPVFFRYQAGIVTAEVKDTRNHQAIDLGIAKLHFELAAGGNFELGNGAGFTKQ